MCMGSRKMVPKNLQRSSGDADIENRLVNAVWEGESRTNWERSMETYAAAAAAKSLQLCLTLCDAIDGSPSGSPVPGILQARTLEWVAISFFNVWKWKVKTKSEVTQSCPTLSDPMDCSLPGSSVHGIFQARELEWGAVAFFKHICYHI